MIFQRIKRKLYKATHPVVGEIWMLHRVVEQRSENPEQRVLEATPDWLEHKILEYKQKGYTFVSIDNLPTLNAKHLTLSTKHYVCITFDDGYRDNYTLAYPLLKRLEVPFAIYVTTGFIDNRMPMWWYPNEKLGISTEELKLLDADQFCTIGAHTVSHPKLDTLTYDEQYQEIAQSQKTLESLLGHDIYHFSFPHGAHNDDTLTICRELGFKTVVQSWGGPIRCGEKPWPMPRINVTAI